MKTKPSRKELEAKIKELEVKVAANQASDDAQDQCEQFYNLCIESAPYGIMVHDDTGRILIFNSQLERISGYRQKEIPDVNTWIEKLYPDEAYRKLVIDERKKSASEKKLREREAIITTKKGEKSLCRFSSLLLDTGVRIVFIKDVAEQRLAEELLHESEERFRLLSEAAFEAIIIHQDGVLLKANDQFFKMFGYKPKELLGNQVVPKVIAPESVEFVKKQIASKSSKPYEATGKRKNGDKFPIVAHAKHIKYQGREVRVVAIRDLSYRKQSEKALRESEEKFRTVAEQSPNMIFINKGGKVVYVNQKCEEMMAYKKDEFYAPEFDFLTLIAPESIETVTSSFKKHSAGQEVEPYEYSLINKRGQIFEVINTTKLINFEGDQAILGIVTDISDRKKAENALKEKDKKLEQQARHLEEVNTALKVLLEHREQEKRELEENLLANIKKLVFPYLEKLDSGRLEAQSRTYLDIIKSNLNDLVSPLANTLSSNYLALTPAELQIADLVKHGKTSKEIAAMLNVSAKAVAFHRSNIRKKMGLTNKKRNLQTHLQSFP
ncbi:MAG: PAS domain S-box protein [Desulfobacterales bacterium]